MSFAAVKWALKITAGGDLPPAAALLLILLADHHNPEHGCFPSQTTLAQRMGVSPGQVRRHLRTLERAGVVKTVSRGRRNGYKLRTDTMQICTVKSDSVITDTVHKCTVDPMHKCTVSPDDTVHKCTLTVLTSKSEGLTGKGKAEVSGKHSAPGDGESPSEEEVKTAEILKKAMAPKTEAEALAKFAAKRAKFKHVTPAMLMTLWRDLHAIHWPEVYLPEATDKDKGKLARAYKLAGDPLIEALPAVLAHWDEMLLYFVANNVEKASGLKHFVTVPHIGVVLACIQYVVAFGCEYAKKASSPAPASPKGKHPKTLKLPLTNASLYLDTVQKPSKDEALALLEEALKGS